MITQRRKSSNRFNGLHTRLFRSPAEELVKIEQSDWQETFSEIHGEDLRLISNSLINLSVLAVRMSAYIDARGGEGGKDRGHEEAVKRQDLYAEKIRALLGFQYPKVELDFTKAGTLRR